MGVLERCASGTEPTESECREAAGDFGANMLGAWSLEPTYPRGCWKLSYIELGVQSANNNKVYFNKGGNRGTHFQSKWMR